MGPDRVPGVAGQAQRSKSTAGERIREGYPPKRVGQQRGLLMVSAAPQGLGGPPEKAAWPWACPGHTV